MKDVVATCDFYEACYYLTLNFTVETVNAFRVNKKVKCEFHIAGENIYDHRETYLKGEAEVNLNAYKESHHSLTMLIYNSKRELIKQEKGGSK